MDDKFAPIFTWSKEYTDEFRKIKLTGTCPNCGEFRLDGKHLQVVKSDGTIWKPSGYISRLERDTYIECTKCKHRIPVCVPRDERTISEDMEDNTTTANNPEVFSTISPSKLSDKKLDFPISENKYAVSDKPTVEVKWAPQEKEVQVATEVIQVPYGVKIIVKRSRTVDHIIEINWRTQSGISIDAGIKQIISTTIHGEIEKSKGRTYHESEKMEYEIELDGEKHNRYKLIWSDIWLKGNSEVTQGSMKAEYPFEFRERSELTVVAVEK